MKRTKKGNWGWVLWQAQAGTLLLLCLGLGLSTPWARSAAITLNCAPGKTVECGTVWQFDEPTASTTCPDGIVIIAPLTTATNYSGCGENFTAVRTWAAIDNCGNSNICSQTVTVQDTTPPGVTWVPSKTVELGSAWSFDAPSASDPCVFYSLVYDDSVNDLMIQFDPGTNEVGDEIALAGTERFLKKFILEYWGKSTHGATFEGAVTARLRFYANDGPPFNGYPTPRTMLFDSGDFSINPATRATLLFTDFVTGAATPLTGPLPDSLTWSIQFAGMTTNDHAGVDVYSPPVVGGSYPDYWLHADIGWELRSGGFIPLDFAAYAEASHSPAGLSITVVNTVTNLAGCGGGYVATRTWLATDPCGNGTNFAEVVTVQDSTAPVITCLAAKTVECGTPWSFDTPSASDQTAGESQISMDVVNTVTNYTACGETFTATRTWMATDPCGNSAVCSQTVTVQDTTPPAITWVPSKTAEPCETWNFDEPSASDTCVFYSLVYDDSVYDLTNRFDPGTNEIGDEIILAGTERYLKQFVFEYWGTSTHGGGATFKGAVTARLRFYANNGTPFSGYPTPGTVLFDSGAFAINPTTRATLLFNDFVTGAATPLTGPLPDSLTWSIQFSGLDNGDHAGVDVFSPPVVGQDYPDYWYRESGDWELRQTTLPMDFAAYATASHSPGQVTVSVLSTTTNVINSTSYVATRAWQATDPCGNSTNFSEVVTVQVPSLTLIPSRQGLNFVMRWPVTCTGFRVQQTTNLNPPVVWAPGVGTIQTIGSEYQFTTPTNGLMRFFRLQNLPPKPPPNP